MTKVTKRPWSCTLFLVQTDSRARAPYCCCSCVPRHITRTTTTHTIGPRMVTEFGRNRWEERSSSSHSSLMSACCAPLCRSRACCVPTGTSSDESSWTATTASGFRHARSRERQTGGDVLHNVTQRGARPDRSIKVLVSTTKPNKRRISPILARQRPQQLHIRRYHDLVGFYGRGVSFEGSGEHGAGERAKSAE